MKILQDIKYTLKMVRGIMSGFDGLQRSVNGGWEYIGYDQAQSRNYAGEYSGSIRFDLIDEPYYVCVAWKNRSHLPLPILIDADSEYATQNMVVKFLHWLWAKTPFCPASFQEAVIDCAHYQSQFSECADSELHLHLGYAVRQKLPVEWNEAETA